MATKDRDSVTYLWQLLDPRTGQRSLPAQGNSVQLLEFTMTAIKRGKDEYDALPADQKPEQYHEHMMLMLFEDHENVDDSVISRVPLLHLSNFLTYLKQTNNLETIHNAQAI